MAAGKTERLDVTEERTSAVREALAQLDEAKVREMLTWSVTSAPVKEALNRLLTLQRARIAAEREARGPEGRLKAIAEEQARLRANLEKLPPTAAAYKRYLEKFDAQETELEKLQERQKGLLETERQRRQELEDYLVGLNVE